MATTAIWSVKGSLGRVVDYAANPDKTTFSQEEWQGLHDVLDYATQDYKTEEQRYVSGINCTVAIAKEQMGMVKRQFGKEGGIVAFHGYQSFAPGEVTPEQAHEIGLELAKRLWGDRFQVVVATHLDREHIHNHFVLNSVSVRSSTTARPPMPSCGALPMSCAGSMGCLLLKPRSRDEMSYDAWEAEQKGKPTWYSQIRRDMDAAITRSFLFEHFIANLKKQGYEVKQGKYIVVRPPGKERFVRLKTLGDNYTEEAIRQRIRSYEQTPLYHRLPSPPKRNCKVRGKSKKLTGFRTLCYHYLYLLGKLGKPKSSPRKSRYLMDEIIKFDRYVEQFKFLTQYRIDTVDQLHALEEAAKLTLTHSPSSGQNSTARSGKTQTTKISAPKSNLSIDPSEAGGRN